MGELRMQALDYHKILYRFKERRDEPKELIKIFDRLLVEEKALLETETCLSVGPGAGQNDLDFLQRCLPNLRKYIAVDKRPSSIELLRENFRAIFGDSVEYEGCVADMTTWEIADNARVDLVWMSHMLYSIPEPNRLIIFENLLKKIIKPKTGAIIFVNNTKENTFQKLHNALGIRPLLSSEDVKRDFEKVGGIVTWSRVYSCDFDSSEYDDDIWYFLMEFSDRILTPEEITKALKTIAPEGKSDYQCEICVVKNA